MRITKQKLQNKQFKKTEEAILRVFFEKKGIVTIEEIARKIGVARSTIYYHHHRVSEILQDYEEYVLREFDSFINKNSGVDVYRIFYQMLIFIVLNRDAFLVLLMGENRRVIIKMMQRIKPKLVEFVKIRGRDEMVFDIYTYEIIVVVKKWGEKGFLMDNATRVLKNILYLTGTVKSRLMPMVVN